MKTMIAALMLMSLSVAAQDAVPVPADPVTAPDQIVQLYNWVKTQQANVGLSYDLHKVKYACTWWDLVSLGSSGLNVGMATAKDFIDLGPATATANAAPTRYGQGVAIHVGNIWNSATAHLPNAIASHVKVTSLPDVTVGALIFEPLNGVLKSWTFAKDLQVAVAYRFGGN